MWERGFEHLIGQSQLLLRGAEIKSVGEAQPRHITWLEEGTHVE